MQLARAGDRALLAELGDVTADQLHAAADAVRHIDRVVHAIPGHSSLYVLFDGDPDFEAVKAALDNHDVREPSPHGRSRTVRVAFDGEDLAEFLALIGLSRGEFLSAVNGRTLVARYLGFRGGFAYLDGWPEEWAMARRATSRPVRRGSFAIAGSVAAFYPIDTPGGWNLLGHTDADLEDAIEPGERLVIEVSDAALPHPAAKIAAAQSPSPFFEVVSGPLAVWTRRPFDELAAALANRAAGNPGDAAVLECPMAGPRIRCTRDATLAWCTPDLGVIVESVHAGEDRTFGRVTGGLRAYLAAGPCGEGAAPGPRVSRVTRDDRHVIRALAGPHDLGWTHVECEVTPHLDRVGIRLRPLHRIDVQIPADLRSIGMQCGTVQLHPDGSLLAMGPDHPITGGYLQPLTVLSTERWKLAQLGPGERVAFAIE